MLQTDTITFTILKQLSLPLTTPYHVSTTLAPFPPFLFYFFVLLTVMQLHFSTGLSQPALSESICPKYPHHYLMLSLLTKDHRRSIVA